YCAERLHRTIANGERKELPCWIELQAAKTRKPIDVSVTLMDGRAIGLHLESASTSAEVCQTVAERAALKDTYGFSLYISLFDKMWSLGSCEKHVLDAVSQCEQEMKRQGKEQKDAPWSLSIRKELFTPWHDCSADPISTDLIYKQVIKGIKSGEYISEKEDEYVQLAMKHYYIRFGSAYSKENVHDQKRFRKKTSESVKGELVDSARQQWPIHFSKFYEVTMISGPPLPKSRFVVAVNWSGVFFMDGGEKRLLELHYLEVKDVNKMSGSHANTQSLSLDTVQGDFVLKCAEAADMAALIESNLEGLRLRSVYAVAQQDNIWIKALCASLQKGYNQHQKNYEEYSHEENLIKATNQRTSSSGVVSTDTVKFLPTLTRPPEDMLELLGPRSRKTSATQGAPQREDSMAPFSLKEFALEHFRAVNKDVGRYGAPKGATREKLWACSREPLKQPMMKSLVHNSDLSPLACNYMGDYPIKHARSPIELTDQIFGPATQHEALQDEIYCQIMRQMTKNSNRLSMERGWQLMWLCSGLFPPSKNLMRHAQHFMESRPRDPLAAVCLQRLKEPRKFPPHLVEVDAIQQNSTMIFHKVHFPNDTDDIFEVTSMTTMNDLCSSVASHLRLSSAEGYGLYLKTPNKVTSLDEKKYFFDNLRQTSYVAKKIKRAKEGNHSTVPYLVIFKRKLWFNVSPGKDQVADLTFHFPQECPKYLRGYHNCTREDMINLGGLLLRCKIDSDRSQFVMIPRMLRELVPADKIKIMSSEEWKKLLIASYKKQSGITVQEAKIAFLRAISSWPTFGCAFFEVKQTCESSYPNPVLIAISKQGVSLIVPKTKELLVMHPFSRITEYHSRGSIFQMTIGTLVKGYNFVCETLQVSGRPFFYILLNYFM
uniref:Myosin VIIBb n=1 Tax=Echeneis naucrates TaxID=173247 RepID=A0A665UHB9_ECHNA